MNLKNLVKPAGLLVAGTFGASANAAVIVDETDYNATFEDTDITLAGAASPQFTFDIEGFAEFATKTYLIGNDGATVAYPGSSTYQSDVMTDSFILGGFNGDYGIRFSANGLSYQGTATIINDGNTIDRISYEAVNGAVPEPGTWAMMILGFGLAGGAIRRARRQPALATA